MVVGSPGGSVVKNLPANARDASSIPGSGRSPGVGNDNPLQYYCLKNSMYREAWPATVHRIAKNQTPPNSTVSVSSQRHPEQLPEVTGKGRETRDQIANIHWIIKKSKIIPEKHLLLLY